MAQKILKNTFTIEEVAEIADVNSFTLRNWEDRYGLFSPDRDANGRRVFSESDTVRAIVAAELTKRHHKISKVAADLQELSDPFSLLIKTVEGDAFIELRKESLAGLLKYDAEEFQQSFMHLLGNYDVEFIADHFLYPMYRALEQMELRGEVAPFQFRYCQQQLADRIFRLIGTVKVNRRRDFNGRVLVSGLPENRYEDSTLILNLVLERSGWDVVYGGAQVNPAELPAVVEAAKVDVVLLVGNNLTVAEFLKHEAALNDLSVPVVVGGSLAKRLKDEGKTSTPQLELTTARPGPYARLLRYKVGITQTSKPTSSL